MKHKIIPLILITTAVIALCLTFFTSKAEAKTYDYSSPEITSLSNSVEGIALEWNADPGAAYYAVIRKTNDGYWLRKAVITDTKWTDTEISSGNTYTYKIRLMDKNKLYISPSESEKSILCLCTRKAYTTVVSTGIKVTWSVSDGASGYVIYRKEKGAAEPKRIGYAKGQNTKSYTDKTVVNGHTYIYYVAPATSSDSKAICAAIDPAKGGERKWNTAPSAPSLAWDGTSAKISWTAIEGCDKVAVYRKINSGGWTRKATLTADKTEWVDTAGKITGNVYQYSIRWLMPNGNISSVRSGAVEGTYVIMPTIKSTENRADGVELTVSANKSIEKFRIWRTDTNGTEKLIQEIENTEKVSKITYMDTTVTDQTPYTYRAEATCGEGSSFSLPVGVTYISPSKPAYVTAPFITLHKSPEPSDEGAAVEESLLYRDEIMFVEQVSSSTEGTWSKIKVGDDYRYIWQDADEKSKISFNPLPVLGINNNLTPWQQDAITKALEVLAQPTAYAHEKSTGTADEDGIYRYDCSGLAAYILDSAMRPYVPVYNASANIITLFREGVSYNTGLPGEFHSYTITKEELQPGDLIFYELQDEGGMADVEGEEAGNLPSHVGIYIGNGEFLHSTHYSWGANGVFVMPLEGYYEEHIFEIRRYMPAEITPANTTMYAASSTVYVRDAGSMSGSIIASVPGTVPVDILFQGDTWSQVRYAQGEEVITGFALNKYLVDALEYAEGTDMVISAVRKTVYDVPQTSLATYSTQLIAGTPVKYKGYFYSSAYAVLEVNGYTVFAYAPGGVEAFLAESVGESYRAGTVAAGSYLRTSPDSTSDENKLRLLKKGEAVKIFATDSSWSYVETATAGERGFVATKNIAAD